MRASIAWRASRRINGVSVDVAFRDSDLVADVWMARILLQAEFGQDAATPTRISRWLWENGKSRDYKQASVRPMVYRALKKIEELETCGPDEGDQPFWEPGRQSDC